MDTPTKPKYSVSFYLDKAKHHLYLFFSYDSQRVKIFTKERLTPSLWDKKRQRARITVDNPRANEINSILNDMESAIGRIFEQYVQDYQKKPEPRDLREVFNKEYFEQIPQFQTKSKNLSFLETFDEYIETKRIDNTESTAEKYEQVKNTLISFGRKHKQQIQYENITQAFRNKYILFLQNDKGYADSTIHRHLKFVKTVILYGINSGYAQNLNINLKKFETKDIPSTKIALSEMELHEIEELDLSKNPRLDRVRDRFLIGCYTGMRYSDFSRLNKNHIQDGKYIVIRQKKVKTNITLPLMDNVRRIFEKYNYNLPESISEPKFNEYLKEITRQCDSLKRLQEITKSIGGREIKTTTPRCELVTSHTARRTFVTLNHARGIDLQTLTIATGHTNIQALKKYLKLNEKEKADILNNAFERANEKTTSGKVIQLETGS